MDLDRESDIPLSQQLAALLRDQIRSGEIPARRPIPSKRTLQQTHDIALGTINKALGILRDEGLIYSVQGMGIYAQERSKWRERG